MAPRIWAESGSGTLHPPLPIYHQRASNGGPIFMMRLPFFISLSFSLVYYILLNIFLFFFYVLPTFIFSYSTDVISPACCYCSLPFFLISPLLFFIPSSLLFVLFILFFFNHHERFISSSPAHASDPTRLARGNAINQFLLFFFKPLFFF